MFTLIHQVRCRHRYTARSTTLAVHQDFRALMPFRCASTTATTATVATISAASIISAATAAGCTRARARARARACARARARAIAVAIGVAVAFDGCTRGYWREPVAICITISVCDGIHHPRHRYVDGGYHGLGRGVLYQALQIPKCESRRRWLFQLLLLLRQRRLLLLLAMVLSNCIQSLLLPPCL